MSLYDRLKKVSRSSLIFRNQLRALELTLDYFGVFQGRKTVGESLLRFRIVKDRKMDLDKDDPLLNKFLQMEQFFSAQLVKC